MAVLAQQLAQAESLAEDERASAVEVDTAGEIDVPALAARVAAVLGRQLP